MLLKPKENPMNRLRMVMLGLFFACIIVVTDASIGNCERASEVLSPSKLQLKFDCINATIKAEVTGEEPKKCESFSDDKYFKEMQKTIKDAKITIEASYVQQIDKCYKYITDQVKAIAANDTKPPFEYKKLKAECTSLFEDKKSFKKYYQEQKKYRFEKLIAEKLTSNEESEDIKKFSKELSQWLNISEEYRESFFKRFIEAKQNLERKIDNEKYKKRVKEAKKNLLSTKEHLQREKFMSELDEKVKGIFKNLKKGNWFKDIEKWTRFGIGFWIVFCLIFVFALFGYIIYLSKPNKNSKHYVVLLIIIIIIIFTILGPIESCRVLLKDLEAYRK
jgi:hypothetical protein